MGNVYFSDRNKCRICGKTDVEISKSINDAFYYFFCPDCGEYFVPNNYIYSDKLKTEFNKEHLLCYLFYHDNSRRPVLCSSDYYDKHITDEYVEVYNVTPEMVENWYPKTISEKIDKAMLKIKDLSKYDGDTVVVDFKKAKYLFFVHLKDCSEEVDEEIVAQQQIDYIVEALLEMQYIYVEDWIKFKNAFFSEVKTMHIVISPKGLAKVYDLQKTHQINKNVFVAMSFHKSADDIRQAIKKGIEDAQYSSLLMDEIYHNHQIVPEMMRLIKESRFMIMDITQPNFGAYYEAGYAQGLDKEVIVTCSEEVWNRKDFTCDKDKNCHFKEVSTKPHFDIAQKQVLKWKNYDDLTKQLSEWIKHIIG